MELYAICVVQNEEDVIRDSIEWAGRFCERIWVWDLGSIDSTWEILTDIQSSRLCVARKSNLTYSKMVRGLIFQEVRPHIPDGAWLYRLDADEFVIGDPRPALRAAANEGAELASAWHLNFYPTEKDVRFMQTLGQAEWERIPLFQRLRSYRVEWLEWRFVRVGPDLVWDASKSRSRLRRADGSKLAGSRHHAMIRHYRYRSPTQVASRCQTRRMTRASGYEGFRYDRTTDFCNYIKSARRCRYWSDENTSPKILVWEVLRYQTRKLILKTFIRNRLRHRLSRWSCGHTAGCGDH